MVQVAVGSIVGDGVIVGVGVSVGTGVIVGVGVGGVEDPIALILACRVEATIVRCIFVSLSQCV